MIENFEFILPTEIQFGRGCISMLPDQIRDRNYVRPLIVTDKGLIKTGIIGAVEKLFIEAGIEYLVFSDTVPNPRDHDCDAGAKFAREVSADVLVAVGGGSAMDTAKAIATIKTNGGTARDWFDVELDEVSAPVICIPTTCGTGAEVTYNAVITNSTTRLKANIFDPKCAPVLALVDPDLLDGLPKHLIASTGMDALTHAVEAYVCKIATPMTDTLALQAMRLINGSIRKAVEKDKDALDQLMLGSLLAGISFGNSDTAAVHSIAECFGGFYDIPHGVTNAIFLPDVCAFSLPGNYKKYANVANILGADTVGLPVEEAAKKTVEKIEELAKELGIPLLSSFDSINEDDFEYLADETSKHCCNENNPIEGTKEDYLAIFYKVFAKTG